MIKTNKTCLLWSAFIMPNSHILSPVKMAQRYDTVIRVHISSKEPTGDDEHFGLNNMSAKMYSGD
jgi:hypothetical protein